MSAAITASVPAVKVIDISFVSRLFKPVHIAATYLLVAGAGESLIRIAAAIIAAKSLAELLFLVPFGCLRAWQVVIGWRNLGIPAFASPTVLLSVLIIGGVAELFLSLLIAVTQSGENFLIAFLALCSGLFDFGAAAAIILIRRHRLRGADMTISDLLRFVQEHTKWLVPLFPRSMSKRHGTACGKQLCFLGC
ncbi:MAG: hypothetical protein JST93_30385 [Acidobacteria bacterium]|nr:hypothetical protein [Acidobacteriota bacterium]